MPQKTRKEKLAAQHRKAHKYTIVEDTSPISVSKREKTVVHATVTEEDIVNRTYFIKDFKKSLILISLIIGLEFFLHFVRISNYFLR